MMYFKISIFWKRLVGVSLHTVARTSVKVIADVQGKSTFFSRASETNRLRVGVLVLFGPSLPSVYNWLIIVILEGEE